MSALPAKNSDVFVVLLFGKLLKAYAISNDCVLHHKMKPRKSILNSRSWPNSRESEGAVSVVK